MTSQLLDKQNHQHIGTAEDDMCQYLNEIRMYPMLSPEEERQLAQRCFQGDEDAIRQMVNSNLRLVVSVAKEYSGRGVPLLDLIQEGSIGLLAAAKRFDYTLDYRFSTYATKWIRRGVTRCLLNHGCMIRVPTHTAERMRKIIQVRHALWQKNGVEPTLDELALACDLPVTKVQQLLQLNPETCSLDAPAGEEEEGTLGLLLTDVNASQPYEELVREELSQTMETLLATLSERQQQVLRLHFGLADGNYYSLEQIGSKLGISKERVRQIERQAMDKLKKIGADIGLEDFLT